MDVVLVLRGSYCVDVTDVAESGPHIYSPSLSMFKKRDIWEETAAAGPG
jgi:hypothetical protein